LILFQSFLVFVWLIKEGTGDLPGVLNHLRVYAMILNYKEADVFTSLTNPASVLTLFGLITMNGDGQINDWNFN